MANLKNRFIGPCPTIRNKIGVEQIDVARFLINLLLFDTFCLESIKLHEFNDIIQSLGYGGTKEIISTGALKVHCEAYNVAQFGQTDFGILGKRKDGSQKQPLPLNSYSFGIVAHTDHKTYMHDNFKNIHAIDYINFKEAKKLKRLIADNLLWYPKDSDRYIMEQFHSDIRNQNPVVDKAIHAKLKEHLNIHNLSVNDIDYTISIDDENDVRVESTIAKRFSIDEQTVHNTIGSALLAVGGLNTRIEAMRAFSALSGFKYEELPLFENKLLFISESIDPEVQHRRIQNILGWPEFPDLAEAIENKTLRIDQFLKIRESKECRDFRRWIWSSTDLDDSELHERVRSITNRLKLSLSSKIGKRIRWLAATGLGSIPDYGLFLGPTVGVLDNFLIDDLLKTDGVVTFLGRIYPSIFPEK